MTQNPKFVPWPGAPKWTVPLGANWYEVSFSYSQEPNPFSGPPIEYINLVHRGIPGGEWEFYGIQMFAGDDTAGALDNEWGFDEFGAYMAVRVNRVNTYLAGLFQTTPPTDAPPADLTEAAFIALPLGDQLKWWLSNKTETVVVNGVPVLRVK